MEHDVDVFAEDVVRSRYECAIIAVEAWLQSDNSWYGRSVNAMSVERS